MKLFPFASLFMCVSSYNLLPRSSNYLYLKRRVSFYPARLKTPVPKELYHNFLDELKENYDVNNNTELLDKNQTEVLMISHSSGAMQLMNDYEKIPQDIPKKVVLIEPIDLKSPLFSFNFYLKNMFDKNYMGEFLSIFEKKTNPRDKFLVLTHEKSSQWKILPLIPPISWLKTNLNNLKNVSIEEKEIKGNYHFDLLDRPWANRINQIQIQKEETSYEEYKKQVIESINEFFAN